MLRSLLLIAVTARLASADGWSPIDSTGWPVGETPATLRDLPPCEGPLHGQPGESIPCRPRILASGPRLAFTMDWTSGPAFGSDRLTGGMQAWGLEVTHALTRSLSLGGRYEMVGMGAMEPAAAFGHHLFGVARYRLWTDEVDRSAWTLSGGLGYAVRREALGGGAPIARAAIAREVGMYVTRTGTVNMGLELGYEHSLGDEPIRAVTASARFGFETNVHEPKRWTSGGPRSSSYTVSSGVLVAPIGFDLGVGVRRGPIGLQTTAQYLMGMGPDDTKLHGIHGASWSLLAGPRLSLSVLYAQAQAGVAWYGRDTGAEHHTTWQGELGVSAIIGGCTGVDVALWAGGELDDAVDGTYDMRGGGFLLRLFKTGSTHARAGDCRHERSQPGFAYEPKPPPPPPPPVVVEREPPPVVAVEPPPPPPPVLVVKPVVVDVTLGAEWLGGAVSVQLDPRLLPLGQLRASGYVEVEVFGPAHALARFEARLRGTLDRHGARADAWVRTTTTTSAIRVRFTIWPPGTRPN